MRIVFILLATILGTLMTVAQPAVHYTLGMSKPSTHLFEVGITFTGLPAEGAVLEVILPVWRPGRYMVFDFAGGVQDFAPIDGNGAPLRWSKQNKSMWRIERGAAREVKIRYNVYANEFNQRTRGLNDEHGFVDGTAVFMYAEEYRNLPLTLDVKPFGAWHVTTALDSAPDKRLRFTAPNYDHFVDCPIEIGEQKDFPFEVDGTAHLLSIYGGEGSWNADTLIRDIAKIVKMQKDFFGEFPYTRYVFLIHCTPTSGGGTEHVTSTIMGARPSAFKTAESYRGFLGLVSHEYFHTWNVKQFRPRGLHPYDYTRENYTEELWIAEGGTSYFDNILLVRAGYITPIRYIDQIASTIQNDRQRPGNTKQSLSEASYDAWVKFWRSNQQAYNEESDYYDKGASVTAFLDLEIRHRTNGAGSLDNVMRAMYKQFPLSGPGYTVDDFQRLAEEEAGGSLQEFFDSYVHGTKPLPWESTLMYVGLEVAPKDTTAKPWLGLTTSDAENKTKVTRVLAGSPAYESGLDIGDEIVALNGARTRSSDLTDRIADLPIGHTITLTVFRNDQLREFKITLAKAPVPGYKINRVSEPTELQKLLYEQWLGAEWGE